MGSKVKVTELGHIEKIFIISKIPGTILTKLGKCVSFAPRSDPMGSRDKGNGVKAKFQT